MNLSKIKLYIILHIILLLFVACNQVDKEKVVEEDISIYFVKDLSTTEAMGKNLDDLPLENMPMLTDKNIKTYNWIRHEFTLSDGFSLEEELEGNVPLNGKPFVVVVNHRRIYLGAFWSPFSSLHIPEIPVIYTLWQKGSNSKHSYKIVIGKNQEDPRSNEDIFKALKGLGKLTN
ncbi:hypothetical protein SY83_10260 [Paenibacillus swuensis]|uniref:Lipoprotein n=1 Tax=Paenibacillus swuensis TaxID=1178515 RepID=A0A172TIH7_9BACL|nr:hypothetical protein [Paenibacillus swuensis]ANE46593.1 hypothetical protein SY83_10260 [Paenibacillus swuensis]